ncbi:hypothetical protein EYF80_010810 [Liparis tanakae]|uniref:Uncharacterized protein n=1 Tax=Liparis tanakae TaxID=230148 RepID=A0A4Z2IN26_9TELE|nr:hypothetical protein EYF80_010810 [Liparis tanakae]
MSSLRALVRGVKAGSRYFNASWELHRRLYKPGPPPTPPGTHRNPAWNMDILGPPFGPYLGVLSRKSFLMDT